MDKFLIGAAIILFVFGAMLLFTPAVVKKISDFLNKNILPVENKMCTANIVSGIILVILAIAIYYLASKM